MPFICDLMRHSGTVSVLKNQMSLGWDKHFECIACEDFTCKLKG